MSSEEAVGGTEDIMAARHDKEEVGGGMTRRWRHWTEWWGDLAILRLALNDSVGGSFVVGSGIVVDDCGIDCKAVRQHEGNAAEGQSAMAC